ncbi:MAG: sulfite exporter TauE/SafE family protein [Bacteroidota bacterium]|nr:permease [Odoribacter sp.]MDP3644667.1 sulfite exporter TauE/SafE family protein [Bacteroidota bacterium]
MSVTQIILLVIIGLIAGIFSGSLGVGGAIIVIPALVFFLGLSQHQAQGTSLAFMIPPVTLLAVINYWKQGYVNWKYALILAFMFFIGAYIGSVISVNIPEKILKKLFGALLLFVAMKMMLSK